jgi:hypothetical protein
MDNKSGSGRTTVETVETILQALCAFHLGGEYVKAEVWWKCSSCGFETHNHWTLPPEQDCPECGNRSWKKVGED